MKIFKYGGIKKETWPRLVMKRVVWENFDLIVGFGIILFMVIVAIMEIGQVPECTPYPWHLPFSIGVILGGLFYFGYHAGKRKTNRQGKGE